MLDVNAAEAIAKPFPAAVVFQQNLKYLYAFYFFGNSLISAIPPALSDIGPKASIANCIAVVAIIDAANATP
jgi:hypothetical protein